MHATARVDASTAAGAPTERGATEVASWLAHIAAIAPYLGRPRSALLQIAWLRKRNKYGRVRRIIREHFDDAFYLANYPEVARLKVGPLRHFILKGWKEGKDPSEKFSTRAYLELYDDVRRMGVNPLLHYLTHGRQEGRIASVSRIGAAASQRPGAPLRVPATPLLDEWGQLPRRVVDPPTRTAVNVIVPVYKSLPHVAATLASVLRASNETPCECLVVDDCSPEPEVGALLQTLARSGHIRLLTNATNLGFVASVNRAMAANEDRDVVLLNADTVVHDGWLDRLMRPFGEDPTIATVTPFSNNATIASYPNTTVDNDYELEVDSAVLDALAAEANGGGVVDVPTGIGFCLAIRRQALASLGLFDAQTFGLGYGEECDFCMRATKAGWRNVLATGVYVRHFGGAAFGPGAAERSEAAQARLVRKHPDYPGRVQRHIAADPALPARMMLDAARLARAVGPISILFFTHTRGGGIETYLRNTRRKLVDDGLGDVADRALVVKSHSQGYVQFEALGGVELPYSPNLAELNFERHHHLLAPIIARLDPELVVVNTFAGLSVQAILRLMEALCAARRPYWHVWHDHQPLCPRLTFLDVEERYCGETDAARCVPCLAATGASFEWVGIEDWREHFRRYLAGAEVISVPSEAAALRARRLAPVSSVTVHPHPEPELAGITPLARREAGGRRRVLILGAIGPHKGAYLIHAMLLDARNRDLPLHFEVVGYTSMSELRTGQKLTLHGRYANTQEAIATIRRIAPDVCLIGSVWPETHVYTLSIAMALGLPVVAFELGAQGERAAAYPRGVVLDAKLSQDPLALNEAVLRVDLERLWQAPLELDFVAASPLSARFLAKAAQDPRLRGSEAA